MTKHTTRKTTAAAKGHPDTCLFQARGVDVAARRSINAVAKHTGRKLGAVVSDALRAFADQHLPKAL